MGNRLCASDGATSNLAGACLVATVLMTMVATALLLTAVATDHWEHVTWNHDALRENNVSVSDANSSWRLEWLLDGQVVRLSRRQDLRPDLRRSAYMADNGAIFLVPVHGGVWKLCPSLDDEQLRLLKRVGYTHSSCISYLSLDDLRPDWQQSRYVAVNDDVSILGLWAYFFLLFSLQMILFVMESGNTKFLCEARLESVQKMGMQNLSIACTLVCLIILGSSALLGVFGILTNQISAVLVTGVMYLLAATFATFTLLLIHFKRHDRPNGHLFAACTPLIDGVTAGMDRPTTPPPAALWAELVTARVVTTSWSLHIGWGGVALCTVASMGWVFLSKLLRQCPW